MAGIIVAFPKKEDAVAIKNILVKNGYETAAVCTAGAQALAAAEGFDEGIVVCGCKLRDMLYTQLRENLPDSFEMLVLASPANLDRANSRGVVSVPMPVKVYDLINTVEMLNSAIMRRKRKRSGSNAPKKRSSKENEIIKRAKGILMDRNNMSEGEAHRYIQKLSMDSGTNMAEMAEMILDLYD